MHKIRARAGRAQVLNTPRLRQEVARRREDAYDDGDALSANDDEDDAYVDDDDDGVDDDAVNNALKVSTLICLFLPPLPPLPPHGSLQRFVLF